MRRTLTIAGLAILIAAGSADAQTALTVPVTNVQLFIPAVSSPLPREAPRQVPSFDERRPLVLPTLYISLAALQGADLYSTHAAMSNGASELNPLLSNVAAGGRRDRRPSRRR